MKNYITRFAILLVSLVLTQTAFADVKIKSRETASGQSSEITTYIKGKRQRSERSNGDAQIISITQCDLKRTIQIMSQSKAFMINLWEQSQSVTPTTTTKTQTVVQKGGVVTTTVTTKDTGERKQMFGYTARHLIITMESVSSPDACNKNKSKMQFDGWYIDSAFALNCEGEYYVKNHQDQYQSGCQDRYEMKQVGTAKRGYPVYEKMTMFDDGGKETFSTVNEIIELSSATLDAALFEVPNGYREVKNSTELYASMSNQSENNYSSVSNGSSNNSGMSEAIKNTSSQNAKVQTEVGAKRAGIVRIGLANTKTGSVGEGLNATELAGAIQNTLSEYLKSPNVELVALDVKLASAIDAEAKQKECDYVIYAQVSHKKGGGGGFGFGKMLGSVVAQTGFGNTGSVAGNIAGQMATTAIVTASQMSESVKSKDELTLDVKINSTGGAAVLAKQFKAKAKSNGEDIISPIIEQAAQAILDAVSKK